MINRESQRRGQWIRGWVGPWGQWRVGRNEGKIRERMIAQESGNQNPIKWNWKNHEAWSQGAWGINWPMVSFNKSREAEAAKEDPRWKREGQWDKNREVVGDGVVGGEWSAGGFWRVKKIKVKITQQKIEGFAKNNKIRSYKSIKLNWKRVRGKQSRLESKVKLITRLKRKKTFLIQQDKIQQKEIISQEPIGG